MRERWRTYSSSEVVKTTISKMEQNKPVKTGNGNGIDMI